MWSIEKCLLGVCKPLGLIPSTIRKEGIRGKTEEKEIKERKKEQRKEKSPVSFAL